MFRYKIAAAAFVLLFSVPAHASSIDLERKTQLQATMFSHIESMLIDGVIPHVMLDRGEIVDLVPTKAHPMIVQFGDDYVLCTDFRSPDGNFVNVDFYVRRSATGFQIYQTEVNNRGPLEKLVQSGKAAMMD